VDYRVATSVAEVVGYEHVGDSSE